MPWSKKENAQEHISNNILVKKNNALVKNGKCIETLNKTISHRV